MNYICFEKDEIVLFNAKKMERVLCFQYQPFKIFEGEGNDKIRKPDIQFHVLLGVKLIDNVHFLLVAEEAQSCCNIEGSVIYQIKKIDWIPIVKKQELQSYLDKTEQEIQDMAKLFDEGHYYYSDRYRLNTTYNFNTAQEQNFDQRKFYSQFIFNQNLMFIGQYDILKNWCKPIIQGYIEQFAAPLTSTENITYTIISRRSNKKQGTRYFSRGIDDKGNVANFTETEQIIRYGKFIISNIQIRGSVPAFFEQLGISGLSGQLQISRSQALTQKAFQLHFSKLQAIYERIFCVNLLSIKKSQQQKLTLFFQTLVHNYSQPFVKYQYFDFHEQCRGDKFENSSKLVNRIQEVIRNFGVTVIDTNKKAVITKQSGVVRTNCLDCLDRTNYMQSRIALHSLEKVLINFSLPEAREEIISKQTFENRIEHSSELLKKFNSAWAQNGDKISLHYTGIGSTHTDITKVGKRTLKGAVTHKMRSLMRFFVQFTDSKKHEAIQKMINNPLMRSQSIQIKQPPADFINFALISLDFDLQDEDESEISAARCHFIENYIQRKIPAGVVIYGFKKGQHRLLKWLKRKKEDISYYMEEHCAIVRKFGYEVIKKIANGNSYMIIFGNEIVLQNVSQIKNQTIQSHKDEITICKFNIYRFSLVFSGFNCSSFKGFTNLLEKCNEEAFQSDKLGQAKSSSILTHHYRTVIGNTASQNKLSDKEVKLVKKQIQQLKERKDMKGQGRLINQILNGDQLSNAFTENDVYLNNYMEAPCYFPPQNNRIIFWNKQKRVTKVLQYNNESSIQCTYGHFSYEIK